MCTVCVCFIFNLINAWMFLPDVCFVLFNDGSHFEVWNSISYMRCLILIFFLIWSSRRMYVWWFQAFCHLWCNVSLRFWFVMCVSSVCLVVVSMFSHAAACWTWCWTWKLMSSVQMVVMHTAEFFIFYTLLLPLVFLLSNMFYLKVFCLLYLVKLLGLIGFLYISFGLRVRPSILWCICFSSVMSWATGWIYSEG